MRKKSKYNPKIHRRKSYRLEGFDYSQEGLYYITICCADRNCFFGKIENDKVKLSEIGIIANEYWLRIPKHFSHVVLYEYVIMPNHIHGIIELKDIGRTQHGTQYRTRHVVSLHSSIDNSQINKNEFGKLISGSVSVIIQQYKSSLKRWCNKNGHEYFKWQPRFYDHIIRNTQSHYNISKYIIDNPINWNDDEFYTPM